VSQLLLSSAVDELAKSGQQDAHCPTRFVEASLKMVIDKVFEKAIGPGLIPGVVTLAADDSDVVYEGASDDGQSTGLICERAARSRRRKAFEHCRYASVH
jgi:hypothetical protein